MKTSPRPSPPHRLRQMHDLLLHAYGPQHWWPAQTAIEVVIGAYLTQNTSWKGVERSLQNLRNAQALSLEGLRSIPVADLQELIRPSGFQTRKAPAIRAFIAMLDAEFSGSLDTMASAPTPLLRKRLLQLPGVGPETADAILLYALRHPIPVADEYLRRIVDRHGMVVPSPRRNRAEYESLTQLTRQAFSSDPAHVHVPLYNEFHALTVAVGKAHCGRVANCAQCPLAVDLDQTKAASGSTSK